MTSRVIAGFLGLFALLNLAGELVAPGFDANLWWIDLRALPGFAASTLLALVATSWVAFALRPRGSAWRLGTTALLTGATLLATLVNALGVVALLAGGAVRSAVPVPLSLVVAVALGLVLRATLTELAQRPTSGPAQRADPASPTARRRPLRLAAAGALSLGACAATLPLGLMLLFGNTDYRAPADVVVVFGARAYADGRPSDALADRVRTGAALVREGWAPWLVVSGGPGDGAVHETEAMRRFARRLGVPDARIVLDRQGIDTAATVAASVRIFARLGARRVLAVSHFYHLPRIQLAYRRAGWNVRTVPARQTYVLRSMPLLVAREIPALWYYWLRPPRPAGRHLDQALGEDRWTTCSREAGTSHGPPVLCAARPLHSSS